jgi:hypothetical protein
MNSLIKYLSHLANTWNNALKWIKERLFDFLGRKELCFFTLNQKMFTTRDKNQIIICLPKNQYFFFFKFYQNFWIILIYLNWSTWITKYYFIQELWKIIKVKLYFGSITRNSEIHLNKEMVNLYVIKHCEFGQTLYLFFTNSNYLHSKNYYEQVVNISILFFTMEM